MTKPDKKGQRDRKRETHVERITGSLGAPPLADCVGRPHTARSPQMRVCLPLSSKEKMENLATKTEKQTNEKKKGRGVFGAWRGCSVRNSLLACVFFSCRLY